MNILIINPPSYTSIVYTKEGRCEVRKGAQLTQPITLGILNSLLKNQGFKVDYYDFMISPKGIEEMKKIFSKEHSIVIISTSTPTFDADKYTAKLIRQSNKKIKICAIGTLVTALPEEALKDQSFNIAFRREPEYTVLELCKTLANKNKITEKELLKIKGISFQINGKIYHNKLRPFIEELDEIPFPARDLFDNSRFIEPKSGKPYTVIRTSRGCPFRCTFCTVRQYYGNKWRTRSVANIIKEIEECVYKYKINNFLFLSDTFTANRDKIKELCNTIVNKKLNIKWVCNSRVDTIDLETAKLMKKAGCWMVSFGVESGSAEILKKINKNISKERAIEASKICEEAGLKTYMYYMIGFPWEQKKTIKETLDLAIKINSDFARFFFAVPYPGTELYDYALKNNLLRKKKWSEYDQASCSVIKINGLTSKELKRAARWANFKYYIRLSYLRKLIRNLTFKESINILKTAFEYFKSWFIYI